jgi:hypothetical protein
MYVSHCFRIANETERAGREKCVYNIMNVISSGGSRRRGSYHSPALGVLKSAPISICTAGSQQLSQWLLLFGQHVPAASTMPVQCRARRRTKHVVSSHYGRLRHCVIDCVST